MGKDTARVAREAHKAAQAARQEAKAAALDAAEKRDAYYKAVDRNVETATRSSDLAAESEHASNRASIAEMAKSPEAPRLRAAAEAAHKAFEEAKQARVEANKALEKAEADKAAAEKVESDTDKAADALESHEDVADAALAAEVAAAKQAADRTAARDSEHGQAGTAKEVELDADDAEAARAAAITARAAARDGYESEAKSIAKVRDEAARDKWKNEQDAKAAEMQVKKEQGELGKLDREITRLNRDADSAAKKGDAPLADSLREKAAELSSDQRIAESRLADAKQAGDLANQAARTSGDVVKEAEGNLRELQQQRKAAEPALDGLEERARLLEEAKSKLAEAGQTGNEKLRQEAEALVQRAEKIQVDRAAIKELAPNLPDETTPPATPVEAKDPVAEAQETKEPGEATGGTPAGAGPATVNPEKVAFIREEIAKGNHVSIGPDGIPASIEPKTPPSPEQIQKNLEAFDQDVSSGKLNGELSQGHSYRSNPDGSGGYTEPEPPTDGTESTPAPAGAAPATVNPEKVAFIREEIAKGNHVSIGPDGIPASIEPKTPPSPEQIQKNLEAFDQDVSSGKLNGELSQGHSYRSNPDGSGGYTEPEPPTDGTTSPDGTADGQPQPVDDGQSGPSAAELREMTVKYSNAAQALHKERVDAKMPDEGYGKDMDARLELKGLRTQLEETTKVRAEWPADIKKHQETADRLNHEATQLDRQNKSKEAEEKREEADLESGTATGLERALKEVDEREETIKARIDAVEKDVETYRAGSAARRQQQDQLEVTADKLDDSARAMGDAYRARLDADELMQQAEQAGNEGDLDRKAQLETKAQAAAAQSKQLLEQARQTVPTDDLAQKALKDAGVVMDPTPSQPADSSDAGAARPSDASAVGDDDAGTAETRAVAGSDGSAATQPGDAPQAGAADDAVGDDETEAGELPTTESGVDAVNDGGASVPPAADAGAGEVEADASDTPPADDIQADVTAGQVDVMAGQVDVMADQVDVMADQEQVFSADQSIAMDSALEQQEEQAFEDDTGEMVV